MAVETFDTDLAFTTGGIATYQPEKLAVSGGRLTRIETTDSWITWAGELLGDGVCGVHFKTAASGVFNWGTKFKFIFKVTEIHRNLSVVVNFGGSSIDLWQKNGEWGTWGGLDSAACTFALDTEYWLRAEMTGDAYVIEVYDADPDVGTPTPIATMSGTLTDTAATLHGAGISGEVGMEVGDDTEIQWYDDLLVGGAGGGGGGVPSVAGGGQLWPVGGPDTPPSVGQLWPR